jgi:hypothetical protein
MRRSGSISGLLLIPLLLAGCAGYGYRVGAAYETVHHSPRHESRYYERVEQDARRYTQRLDRALHLSQRQERSIARLLMDRTYALLDRTPRSEHDRVYPFPRQDGRRMDRFARRWWQETDRRIEHHLNRRQVRQYRAWNHSDYDDDGYDRRRNRYDG